MTYDLRAVIAGSGLLQDASRSLAGVLLVPLRQGLSLMPMTDELLNALTDGSAVGVLGFWSLPGGFDRTLANWSVTGPVAYVEAEYFGGVGEQRAAVWSGGALARGPLHSAEWQPFPAEGSPISQALRRLGAVAGPTSDEFAAVGLDRCRSVEDWIAAARCTQATDS